MHHSQQADEIKVVTIMVQAPSPQFSNQGENEWRQSPLASTG